MSEARHIRKLHLRKDSNGRRLANRPTERSIVGSLDTTTGAELCAPQGDVDIYPLARGSHWQDTEHARWAMSLVCRLGLPTDPVGRGFELDGDGLDELQLRTQNVFVRPVYRIVLHEPLLAFRFYGGRALPTSQLYTSLHTVRQIPRFGWIAKELLGLTVPNSAEHLVAVCLAPGSQIAVGGISDCAAWADQIFVERDRGLTVVGQISRFDCEADGRTERAS